MKAFLGMHAAIYRSSGGKVMGKLGGMNILLLTTTGRKSKQTRTIPISYFSDGDAYVLTGSNNGRDQHPGWYFNLKADPHAKVQVGAEVFDVTAVQASPDEKKRLWAKLINIGPNYANYAKKTTRDIPMMMLRRSK